MYVCMPACNIAMRYDVLYRNAPVDLIIQMERLFLPDAPTQNK